MGVDKVSCLKNYLKTNNIVFEEITANETRFTGGSQTTIVVDENGELCAFKLCNKTQATNILKELSAFTQLVYLDVSYCKLTQLPAQLQELTKLQTLNISSNGLMTLPSWLHNLTDLQTLDISSNGLTKLPEGLKALTKLQTLNISHNCLSRLPEGLKELTRLQTLNINRNCLSRLPEGLKELTHLQTLNISYNGLMTLPSWLHNLTDLQTLDISYNKLSSLPEGLKALTKLQTLNISHNCLSRLPEGLKELTHLQTLNMGYNGLMTLPSWLHNLTDLQTLDISSNGLTKLPEELKALTKLQTLTMSSNRLSGLPEGLKALTKLQTLDISSNGLTILPDLLQNLTSLQTLDISFNGLSGLPEGLKELTRLQTLNIRYNGLSGLPEGLKALTKLQTLDICANGLMTLPSWLHNLTSLQILNISANGLSGLPEGLKELAKLQTLNISHNRLLTLPEELKELISLQKLEINNNPFQTLPPNLLPFLQNLNIPMQAISIHDVPDEFVKQGWLAIWRYYTIREEESRQGRVVSPFPVAELRVMIIGEGCAGKSCISKALKYKDMYEHDGNESSTVGIELRNIEHTFGQEKWLFRLWDFGGQEAYSSTQTLFMTKQTLYLVVVDARAETRPDPHLHYVRTFAPGAPIILVINKVEQNKRFDLNRPLYLNNAKYPCVHHEIVRFSCVEDRRRHEDDLFRVIENVLNDVNYELLRTNQWPRIWRRIKDELITRLGNDKSHITAKEYEEICMVYNLLHEDGEIVRNACDLLGVIFCTDKDPMDSTTDWLMNPKWITRSINCLFKLDVCGFYTKDAIFSHMEKNGCNADEIRAILSRLKKRKVIFEFLDQIFIPALLPSNESAKFPIDIDWSLPEEGQTVEKVNREIRFRYPFLPPFIKQDFMVDLYACNKSSLLYRYSAYWECDDGVCIVMMEDGDDLVFYLQGDSYYALYKAQKWLQHVVENINQFRKIGECDLIHVFRKTDEKGEKQKDEYSDTILWRIYNSGTTEEILLPNINQMISPKKILTGNELDNRAQNMTSVHCETYINQTGAANPVGQNNGTIIYNPNDARYSELQDFLKHFLDAQTKVSKNLTEEEAEKISDIINTQKPDEGKKKFTDLLIPFLSAGAAGTNLLTAMINFSNTHPNLWLGVKAFFDFFKH